MDMSSQGLQFVERHEGFVSRAYRDPVGVWTIGTGFTNGSKIATDLLGRIGPGKTISREINAGLLSAAMAAEYEPPVEQIMPTDAQQQEFDAAGSFVFNCGPGATEWRWAKAWSRGDRAGAAAALRTTATTAKGRKLKGLVTRRAEEAKLFLTGNYGSAGYPRFEPADKVVAATSDPILRKYQGHLKTLGFYKGAIDGLRGPKTTAAVRAFQQAHPQLVMDGILGKATMAQIDRVMDLRRKAGTQPAAGGVAGGAAGAGGSAVADPSNVLGWGITIAVTCVVVVLALLAWRYRDEIRLAIGRRKS